MFIKLHTINDLNGEPLGVLLLDVGSIESVKEYNSSLMPGSEIILKPVINGFLGDNDRIYKFQNTHHVAETVDEIERLILDSIAP